MENDSVHIGQKGAWYDERIDCSHELIMTAFELMVGIVKPADALKRIGSILAVVIALIFAPCILVSAWLTLSLWQRIGLDVIGVCVCQWQRRNSKHGRNSTRFSVECLRKSHL